MRKLLSLVLAATFVFGAFGIMRLLVRENSNLTKNVT